MAKNFIIYVPKVGEDHAIWAMANDAGVLAAEPTEGTLEELVKVAEGKRSIVVLPGDDVLLAEAKVPGATSRAQQAVPFVLEDLVADDVDELHFAIGNRGDQDNYPVAVIHRDTMDKLSAQMAEVGLRPAEVVPEMLALPKFDATDSGLVWTALVDQDQTVVRLNGYKGFVSDTSTASMMLNGARREMGGVDGEGGGMVMFQTVGSHTEPKVQGVEIETRQCDNRLSLYAAGLAKSPRINLLQGDYSLKQQFDKAWKPWRWSMVLAVVLLCTFAAGSVFDYFKLGQQEKQLNAQIDEAFRQALPGIKIRNPVKQIKSRLRDLSEGPDRSGFTVELGDIAKAISSLPETTVKSISYRKGRFDIDMTTQSLPLLDTLEQEIEKNGSMTMTVQSANRQDGVVRSRIRLEAK